MESESQRKSYCVMEDIYGVIAIPKGEFQLHPLSPSLKELQFTVPDLGKAFQVFFSSLFAFFLCEFLSA